MKPLKQIRQRHQPEHLPAFFESLHPVLARVYSTRDICAEEQLDTSLHKLMPFSSLKGIDDAVDLLIQALSAQHKITIIGDFDADGATSTAVAMRALRLLGHSNMDYLIPGRFEFGYGLTPEIVDVAAQQSKPDLIITVDNGIASVNGVQRARSLGIKVLVTDHHLPGDVLPQADAIVNPNQNGCRFPCKATAGVGVVFYLMLALRSKLRKKNHFNEQLPEPNLAELLDLVALGTVADVVPLEHNNRIMVAQGLARMRAGKISAGLKALIDIAGRNLHTLTTSDLGFSIAPRLNAAGRLENMSLGIECLLCQDETRALEYAQQLDELNRSRRSIEKNMRQQAFRILDEVIHAEAAEGIPSAIVLFQDDWHEGVIGILASRIKDHFHRPVIAFAQAEDGRLKGSARSIPGIHIRDMLDEIDKQHPDIIIKFGGHAMAAGLTIRHKDIARFEKIFIDCVHAHLSEEDMQGVITTDGALQASEMNLSTAEVLQFAGPWGQMFPEPVFDGRFGVVQRRVVGEHHLKLVLQPPGSQILIDAIAFNTTDQHWHQGVKEIDAVYKLDVNEFRGQRNPQLIIEQLQIV